MSKLFDFGLLQTMDLFKLWELIEFIPPEHLHSDEMLENPHFGVASNDEPVQIDLKCPNGRCIALDLHGFTTWIMFNSHGFTQWEHGPHRPDEIWMRTWVAKAAQNSPDSMPIGRHCPSPCVTNRVCEPPVFFIPYDSYGCVQKKTGCIYP